ncbi:MAG: iron ABC transporter ATP-binding protein [Symbiobacterium thermophilum]|uniref:Iron ABC transporter ATP-binding protein n=1 Tax=Symbiobacterium thermophilum TaxID=2734 RepID=A0A1Y2T5U8_SYMTR|nr:MAG: iron ABC transporter ATP-binding protein [Symbiobacterium thermophilum]PZN71251.1 MAG: iron ABC transporter ATP-binding protein [Bacillota bacterium]
MVKVRGVSKSFGPKRVLHDVSLEIAKGKVTTFIGPNGAGKSTLLSVMSRLLPKDSGKIFIDGREIGEYKSDELARRLAILKQTHHLNIRLTVRELVEFGRFPYSHGRLTREDREMVDQALAYLDLQDIAGKYLDQLSGGQRQRAFIAMVLAQDTEYVLLDEPLNNLDMKHAVQIMRILRRLADDLGKTVVLVLHDVNFASAYSDRIVALKDGRVAAMGTPDELIRSDVLGDIYEMQIPIETVGGCRVCIYFTGEQAAAL